jgi:hypothetical protein
MKYLLSNENDVMMFDLKTREMLGILNTRGRRSYPQSDSFVK